MKAKITRLVMLMTTAAALWRCGQPGMEFSEIIQSASPGTTGATGSCGADTWYNYAQNFFAADCVSCHAAGSTYDATTYAAVMGDANNIQAQISSGAMPQGSSLAAADKTRILGWIACGLPQGSAASSGTGGTGGTGTTTGGTGTTTGGTAGGTSTTTTGGTAQCTADTWANYAQAFFSTNCVPCHTAGSANDATTYAAVTKEAAAAEADIQSGKMPLGTTLSTSDKSRIVKWFECKLPQ